MRPKILLKILVIVGVIFFTGRLVSHFSLFFAENQDRAIKTRCLKASYWFFPLDYFSAYKYAFGWLEQGFNKKDNKRLEKSIHWFKKSIRQNPFFHLSHHHLGKAYLFHDYPHSEFFDEGVKEIKRAVEIYQNNKIMVRDTAEILLSMWPLLSEADKELSRELLLKYMSRFSWEEFKPLVELWWLYSREIPFMETLLDKNPGFLSPVARLLIQLEGPLNLRWIFLAGYETHVLNRVIRKYRHGPSGNESPLEFELSLLDELREIKGYDNFTDNKKFNQERFQKHKILLINKCIQNLITQYPENRITTIKNEIARLITEYLASRPELKDLLMITDPTM
jgi:tetratricopeptide (TPR) repeat protein